MSDRATINNEHRYKPRNVLNLMKAVARGAWSGVALRMDQLLCSALIISLSFLRDMFVKTKTCKRWADLRMRRGVNGPSRRRADLWTVLNSGWVELWTSYRRAYLLVCWPETKLIRKLMDAKVELLRLGSNHDSLEIVTNGAQRRIVLCWCSFKIQHFTSTRLPTAHNRFPNDLFSLA